MTISRTGLTSYKPTPGSNVAALFQKPQQRHTFSLTPSAAPKHVFRSEDNKPSDAKSDDSQKETPWAEKTLTEKVITVIAGALSAAGGDGGAFSSKKITPKKDSLIRIEA
ncbi:MAG: hypothetical protein VKJ06_00580 [Vampirovibrionales bacterium]|nr:hypothetical protein [Vampirovibrionales bacterium]